MEEDIEEHDTFPDLSRVKTEVDENEEITIEDYNPYLQVKEEIDYIYKNETEGHHEQQDFNAVCMSSPAPDIPGTNFNMSLARLGMSQKNQNSSTVNMCQIDPSVDKININVSHLGLNKSWDGVTPSNGSQNTVIPLESTPHILFDNRCCSISDTSHKSVNQSCGNNSSLLHNLLSKPLNASNSPLKYSKEIVYGQTHKLNSPISNVIISNKLILGSKPANTVRENVLKKEFLPAVVVLEDWANILVNNTCYCQRCEILFPTENSLDAHKMAIHSFLVALDINDTDKNTYEDSSESGSDDYSEIESINDEKNSNGDVSKPVYPSPTVIRKKQYVPRDGDVGNITSSRNIQKAPKSVDDFNKMITGSHCNHCNKTFDSHTTVIKHLYSLLPEMYSCDVCQLSFDNEQQYFDHQHTVHLHEHVKQYKCIICNLLFNTYPKARYHKNTRHIKWKSQQTLQTIFVNINKSNVLDNKTIRHEKKKEIKSLSYTKKFDQFVKPKDCVETVNKNNYNKLKDTIMKPVANRIVDTIQENLIVKEIKKTEEDYMIMSDLMNKDLIYYYRKTQFKNPPIPIGILYKCNKCDLHLLSVMTALYHSRICTGTTVYVKCQKCHRNFKKIDMNMHEFQHLASKSFKVYLHRSDLHSKVLCRCPKCNIYFKELAYWQHLKKGCEKKFVHCRACNLKISDKDTYKLHLKYHSDNSRMGMLIVDHLDYRKFIEILNKGDIKYKLLYCEKCNACSVYNKNHPIYCKKLEKCLCNYCGLYFTKGSIHTHNKLHMKKSLNLHNFLLFSKINQKYIQPPVQNFIYCPKCYAHYMDTNFNHKCFVNRNICNVCLKVFDGDTAHKLHEEFHKYILKIDNTLVTKIVKGNQDRLPIQDKPNVLDNEPILDESIKTHYIYQCIKCLEHTRCYDAAVIHAQGHILSTKSSPGLYCKKCEKYFDVWLFKSHDHNIDHYKVLKYDYLNIFNENWFDMFKGLHQVEVEKILSVSLYKDTRSVRVKLMKKGDPKLTIYVCQLCDLAVDKNLLAEHISNSVCSLANSKFKCSTCNIYFYSLELKEVHEELHWDGVTMEDFRILTINHNKRSQAKNRLLYYVREKSNLKDLYNETLVLYKCKVCNICFEKKHRVNSHECSFNVVFNRFCYICKQYFPRSNSTHKNRHRHNVKFNVVIDYFDPINKGNVKDASNLSGVISDKKYFVDAPLSVNDEKLDSGDSDEFSQSNNEVFNYQESSQYVNENSQLDNLSQSNKIENLNNQTLILYKCKNCKICIEANKYVKYHHHCTFHAKSIFFCNTCKQYFSINNTMHQNSHKGNIKFSVVIEYFEHNKNNKISISNRIILKRKKILNMSSRDKISFVDPPESATDEKHSGDSDKHLQSDNCVSHYEKKSQHSNLDYVDERSQLDDRYQPDKLEYSEMILYKCRKCKICLEHKVKLKGHHCSFHVKSKRFCNTCKQYFPKQNQRHQNKHKDNNIKYDVIIKYFEPGKIIKFKSTRKIVNNDRKKIVFSSIRNNKILISSTGNKIPSIDAPESVNVEDNCGDSGILSQLDGVSQYKENDQDSQSNKPRELNTDIIVNSTNLLRLFKCKNCEICLEVFRNMKSHHCTFDIKSKRFCNICKQYFSKNNFIHQKKHKDNIKFNVIISYFEPDKTDILKCSGSVEKNDSNFFFNSIKDKIRFIDDSESVNDEKSSGKFDKFSQLNFMEVSSNDDNSQLSNDDSQDVDVYCKSESEKSEDSEIWDTQNSQHSNEVCEDFVVHSQFDHLSQLNKPTGSNTKIALYSENSLVLFKCKNCKLCLESNTALRLHNCASHLKFKRFCNICKQYFAKNNARHIKKHEGKVKFNVIISYFEPGKSNRLNYSRLVEKYDRMKILSSSTRDKIKFIDECENINDEKSLENLGKISQLEHKVSDNYKNSQLCNDISRDVEEHSESESNKLEGLELLLYKCKNCEICIVNHVNIKTHSCTFGDHHKRFCNICKQYIGGKNTKHVLIHKDNVKLNVIIVYFEPRKINKKSKDDIPIASSRDKIRFVDDVNSQSDGEVSQYNENSQLDNEISQDVNKNSRSDDLVFIFYKCKNCNMCVELNQKSTHVCNIDNYKRFCDICKEYFTNESYTKHLIKHEDNTTANIIIRYFRPETLNGSNASTGRTMKEKISVSTSKRAPKRKSLNKNKQTNKQLCGNDEISQVIEDSLSSDKVVRTEKPKKKIRKLVITGPDLQTNADHSNNTQSQIESNQGQLSLKNMNGLKQPYDLYVCSQCIVHFLCKKSWDRHSYIKKHAIKVELVTCIHCKLTFTIKSLKTHLQFHNTEQLKTPGERSSIRIIDVANHTESIYSWLYTQKSYKLSQIKYIAKQMVPLFKDAISSDDEISEASNSSQISYKLSHCIEPRLDRPKRKRNVDIIHNISQSNIDNSYNTDKFSETEPDNTKNSQTYVYNVYVCSKCSVYFLLKRSWEMHSFNRQHVVRRGLASCIHCRLTFTIKSLNVHLKFHNTESLKQASERSPIKIIDLASHTESIYNWHNTQKSHKVSQSNPVEASQRKQIVPQFKDASEDSNDSEISYKLSHFVAPRPDRPKRKKNTDSFHNVSQLNFSNSQVDAVVVKEASCSQDNSITDAKGSVSGTELLADGEKGTDNTTTIYNMTDRVAQVTDMFENYSPVVALDAKEGSCYHNNSVTDAKESVNGRKLVTLEEENTPPLEDYVANVKGSTDKNEFNVSKESSDTAATNKFMSYANSDHNYAKLHTQNEVRTVQVLNADVEIAEAHKDVDNDIEIAEVEAHQDADNADIIDLTEDSDETPCNSGNSNKMNLVNSEVDEKQNEIAILKKPLAIDYTIKLFNCSQCDVYFIDEDRYKNHVNDHVALKDKEFIQCKLCMLQFFIIELHLHMLNHHDTEFDFEKVLVEEHSTKDKRKKLYQLKYKLQSGAITTTCTEACFDSIDQMRNIRNDIRSPT